MDIRYITDNLNSYRECLQKRFMDDTILDKIIQMRTVYVAQQFDLDALNRAKKIMSRVFFGKYTLSEKEKTLNHISLSTDPEEIRQHLNLLSYKITELSDLSKISLSLLKDMVSTLPNILCDSVPVHKHEDNNKIERSCGDCITRQPLDQYELCTKFSLITPVSHLSGNRGYMLVNDMVRLNYALMNYALDFITPKGFTLLYTPHFMNSSLMSNICQLSEFDDTLYKISGASDEEDKYLIATSEQILTAFNASNTFHKLPVKQCGVSTCFRKEVGAHGKDTLGIFRVHQFEKVEQFCITDCDSSWEMMEYMINNAEEFYTSLGIGYRIINIVSGALNNAAAMKYDLEGWFPGSGKFRELVSCSNTTDYFSRRLKSIDSKGRYVHMLNSTLYANTRTLCCILETYQNEDSITIPKVLIPYFGKDKIILH